MNCCIADDGRVRIVRRDIPVAGDGDVVIKVYSTALNRADLMQRAGKYPPPPGATDILGLECSGEIVSTGSNCKFQIGDKVMALCEGGSYAEYCLVRDTQVMRIPVSLEPAAGIPETWLTSYQLIHLIAKVSEDDSILVHAGASGIGCAVIQLAKLSNVRNIIVTASCDKKLEFCKELGATHGFNYKTEDWASGVLQVTGGVGCNVILDPIGMPYAQDNCRAISLDGRWILYGLMGGASESMFPIFRDILMKRVHLIGTTLRSRDSQYKEHLVARLSSLFSKFEDQTLKVIVDRTFEGLSSANDAQDYMGQNKSIGKILIKI